MEFAVLNAAQDAVKRYPVDINRFLLAVLGINYKSGMDVEALTGGRVVPVVETAKPAQSHLYRIEKGTPVYNAPNWEQTWNTVTLPAGQQTKKLNDKKRELWAQVNAIGEGMRHADYSTAAGDLPLSGDGLAMIALMAAVPGARTVRLKENAQGIPDYVSATGPQVANVVAAVSDYFDQIAANEYALQQAIIAASDFPALAAIDITAGWP